jgi:lycopene beta-cyclase
MKRYDFIIAGGGMAGLSLAYYLTQSPLRHKSVLILDRELKTSNDRTWCFWERRNTAGPFESIIYCRWDTVTFHGTTYAGPLGMGAYQYKMLRGIDFYRFLQEELEKWPNIERKQVTIEQISDTTTGGQVKADGVTYEADYVFDSTYQLTLNNRKNHNLLQHFKGWVLTTEKPCFDPKKAEIMDFRIEQHGDCRFVYVLPFDEKTALVEFTLFNDKLLTDAQYDSALRQYIEQYLETGGYTIRETEFGIIPMSDVRTEEQPARHIVRIGTSGGATKASTGYTFQRTQRYLREIVQNMAATGLPHRQPAWFDRRFKLYDSIFLNVLEQHRHPADDVFTRVYVNNPERVFRFLDEDTHLGDELKLFTTMPWWPFTAAFFAVMRRKWVG